MRSICQIVLVMNFMFIVVSCEDFCDNGAVDIAFYKLGIYRGYTNEGAEYQKTFLVPKYFTASWAESKAICKSFNLELASFETLFEANNVLNMGENMPFISSRERNWIDGIVNTPKSVDDWYWTNSGKKISFPIPWAPNQPDFDKNNEFCLSIGQFSNKFGFNDLYCTNVITFICQRTDYFIPARRN